MKWIDINLKHFFIGELLATITTNQVKTSHAAVSTCGRFVASSGFTPDVKVWEVLFDKPGNFKEVSRAFELKGHSAGIHHFAFSGDSTRYGSGYIPAKNYPCTFPRQGLVYRNV